MMPNVTRGDRMAGLMTYLVGPGRGNEHTEPHLVAGDAALMAWHDDNELGHDDGLVIARHLDRPKQAHGVQMKGGHVWHCSLSLRADEGQLTDDMWREITESFVSKMGFDDAEGAKAPARWVVVRHGLSTNGNDHVHVVVDLVREDGTKASIHNDHIRAQKACREVEGAHGLQRLESAERGRASRGYDPAEREAQARRQARGQFEQARRAGTEKRAWWSLQKSERDSLVDAQRSTDQPRWALARTVRGCATASADEAEFVRRMRRQGVLVRARYAEGTEDVITGYSVAAKPELGERPIWYGGGHLARDLTLPRLRAEWPDTAEGSMRAAGEWTAAKRGRRPVAPGREMHEPDPALWREVGRDLEQLREQLRSVPIEDRETWARVARQTSGAFAAWSARVEETPGPLAATSDALARTAELRRRPVRPERAASVSASGAALLLISAAKGGRGAVSQAVLLRQLANLAKAVYDMHRADQDARRAAEIERAIRRDLATVSARLPDPGPVGQPDSRAAEVVRTARQAQSDPQYASGSPVPNRIETERARRTAGNAPSTDRHHGIDR